MVDPVWAGVIGGAVGSGTTVLVALATPFVGWWVEAKKLDKTDESERLKTLQEHRREMVRQWREGIHTSHMEFCVRERTDLDSPQLNLTGRPWFESLRPHLKDLTAPQINEISWSFAQPEQVKKLADQVARIEQYEWKLV